MPIKPKPEFGSLHRSMSAWSPLYLSIFVIGPIYSVSIPFNLQQFRWHVAVLPDREPPACRRNPVQGVRRHSAAEIHSSDQDERWALSTGFCPVGRPDRNEATLHHHVARRRADTGQEVPDGGHIRSMETGGRNSRYTLNSDKRFNFKFEFQRLYKFPYALFQEGWVLVHYWNKYGFVFCNDTPSNKLNISHQRQKTINFNYLPQQIPLAVSGGRVA